MRPSLLRNYLLISLGITLLFVLLVVFVLTLSDREKRHEFESNHSIFFARLIDEASPENKERLLEETKNDRFFSDIWILNSDGSIHDKNTAKALNLDTKNLKYASTAYDAIHVDNQSPQLTIVTLRGPEPKYMIFSPREQNNPLSIGPPLMPPPGVMRGRPHLGPPPVGPSGSPPEGELGPPPMSGHGPMGSPPSLLFPLGLLLTAILLSSGVSVLILFLYLKRTSELADSVIENIKSGNLKARFPIKRMNEVGRLMNRFNLMANEIEGLFDKLKLKERTRIQLLQELAHDLRTPLASLTNMLGTMSSNSDEIPAKTRREMLDLSLRETSYLAKLVEDLLLLSQISDPDLESPKKHQHNLIGIIEGELEKLDSLHSHSEKPLLIINEIGHNPIIMTCDLQLMTRLFRNIFDNAFVFAKSSVRVSLATDSQKIEIRVQNDGQGFSQQSLLHFGERKVTRIIQGGSKDRISVGLGSVIIKAIAQIHNIEVTPSNLFDEANKVIGAEILLTIKI